MLPGVRLATTDGGTSRHLMVHFGKSEALPSSFGKSMRGDRGGSWSMRRMIGRIFDVMEFSFMERIGSGRRVDGQATGLEQI